jgi:hypothetical protein
MILHAPKTFRGDIGTLSKAGFKPQDFLSLPTLGPHLQANGVKPYAFQHRSIANSGLSQMFQRNVEIYPFSTPADLWVSMRQLIENKPKERQYIWTYWGEVDGLSHFYGPEDDRVVAEFSHFSTAFEQFFLNQLSSGDRKDTLIILTADHGQIHTPLVANNVLKNHSRVSDLLHISPTGENRMTYFHLRPESELDLRTYLISHWADEFTFVSPDQAIEAGLFGPGKHHPGLRDRIGDLIAFSHNEAYLWWEDKEDFMLGRHGGLHQEEMIVPFLGARF